MLRLIADLEQLSLKKDITDAEFADAVYAAISEFGIEGDLKKHFSLTEGAAMRWAQGKNLPQPFVRPKIIAWLAEQGAHRTRH